METMTELLFECENGDTIRIRRPKAYDIFNANAAADQGGNVFKDTVYFNSLLLACWDRGKDLSYLKKLEHEEGIRFYNVIQRFFNNKITGEDIKKYSGQSKMEDSPQEN